MYLVFHCTYGNVRHMLEETSGWFCWDFKVRAGEIDVVLALNMTLGLLNACLIE